MLVSEESYSTFNPMLPEALGASIFPEQVVAPIRQMVQHVRFVMGRVSAIDPIRKTVTATTLAGERTFAYAQIVLAFGNRARLDLIPGLAEKRAAFEGRIVVNSDLSVRDTLGVWAIGDCALVPNARDDKFAPAMAQFAVR